MFSMDYPKDYLLSGQKQSFIYRNAKWLIILAILILAFIVTIGITSYAFFNLGKNTGTGRTQNKAMLQYVSHPKDFQNATQEVNQETTTQNTRHGSRQEVLVAKWELTMNSGTHHKFCYLSTDKRTLSNKRSSETPGKSTGKDKFTKYRGIVANQCVKPESKVYFEISFSYELLKKFVSNWILLDFGFSERNSIDSSHMISDSDDLEWAVYIFNCEKEDQLCMRFSHKSNEQKEIVFSDNIVGTKGNNTFGLYLNREKETFTLINVANQTAIYTFNNVSSPNDLCPVFGACMTYSRALVTITILDSFQFVSTLKTHPSIPSSVIDDMS